MPPGPRKCRSRRVCVCDLDLCDIGICSFCHVFRFDMLKFMGIWGFAVQACMKALFLWNDSGKLWISECLWSVLEIWKALFYGDWRLQAGMKCETLQEERRFWRVSVWSGLEGSRWAWMVFGFALSLWLGEKKCVFPLRFPRIVYKVAPWLIKECRYVFLGWPQIISWWSYDTLMCFFLKRLGPWVLSEGRGPPKGSPIDVMESSAVRMCSAGA